jgi:hypothetical protein
MAAKEMKIEKFLVESFFCLRFWQNVFNELRVNSVIEAPMYKFVYVDYESSSSWFDAHWSFHTTTLERRKKFWCSTQQALFSSSSHGYPCLYRVTC